MVTQQIGGWLKRQYPDDPGMQISHEAIYRSLFIQSHGVLKKELMAHLRTRRQMRLAKGAKSGRGHGQIIDMVSIRERPAEADDRAVPGHWEGDMLTGANDTHIATLVERHSRFTMLVKLKRKDSATVVAALAEQIGQLPEELWRSLTWDQGKEMAHHPTPSPWPPTSRSTSAICALHGSAAATRTPTACCCGNTSPEEPTSPESRNAN
jgi:IS30 family transposase